MNRRNQGTLSILLVILSPHVLPAIYVPREEWFLSGSFSRIPRKTVHGKNGFFHGNSGVRRVFQRQRICKWLVTVVGIPLNEAVPELQDGANLAPARKRDDRGTSGRRFSNRTPLRELGTSRRLAYHESASNPSQEPDP